MACARRTPRRRWNRLAAVCALVALVPARPAATTEPRTPPRHEAPTTTEIPIRAQEASGLLRKSWPVRTGVPFARGQLRDGRQIGLRLLSPSGSAREVPVQTRVLGRWPDGSVRWALLDWQADLSARGRAHWIAHDGGTKSPPRAVRVEDTGAAVAIDTGPLSFEIPRARFALVENVRLRGEPTFAGTPVAELDVNGVSLRALAPERVTVLENGPLRVRVELRGQYGSGFRYVVRVDAFAGQDFLRVLHSFENAGGAAYASMRRLSLRLPLRFTAASVYRLGREGGGAIEGQLDEKTAVVWQKNNAVLVVDGAEEEARLAGWVTARDGQGGIAIATRFLWQEYPQGFELRRDSLTYHLWPPQAVPAKVGMGAAKTHEFFLHFHGPDAPAEEFLEGLGKPLLAHVDPRWTASTGALPNSVVPEGPAKAFLDGFAVAYEAYRRRADEEVWEDGGEVRCTSSAQARRGFYGMFNWGDWNFPGHRDDTKGCDAWGNLEYDLPQVLALAYAATGEQSYHDGMVAAARHFMDVDRIHFHAGRPAWVGMNHPKNPLHFAFELGGIDLGHTWTEGLFSYYALTGDERGLDAARGIADYLVRRAHGGVRGNPRQWGWPQIALVAAYRATGEGGYARAARIYARGGMASHAADSSAHWKMAILADGLAYTHALTGDSNIRDWLRRFAEWTQRRGQSLDQRHGPALAYVGAVESDEAAMAAAMEIVRRSDLGSWGKPLTIAGRGGFRVLSLSQAGRSRGAVRAGEE